MQASMWWVRRADYADWARGEHSKMAFVDEDPESLFSEDDNAPFIRASQEYKASAVWSTADDDYANQYVKDYEIYLHVNIDLTLYLLIHDLMCELVNLHRGLYTI